MIYHPFRTQRGASLIETMVGITIGLLVALAAVGTVMVTRQGSTTVSESYRLTTAGNNAMRLIAMTVRQAGAMELEQPLGVANSGVMFQPMTWRAANATGDQIVSGTEGASNAPDTLIVSYQHRANTVTRDCLGNAPAALPARIDNTFSINPAAPLELRCIGSVNPAAPQALVGDNANPNAEIGVVDFQVWYWVQDALGQQRRVTAADPLFAAPGGWASVQVVEVCLHLRGIRTNYPAANINNCQGTSVANGGRLHQVFRGTYKLRNRVA